MSIKAIQKEKVLKLKGMGKMDNDADDSKMHHKTEDKKSKFSKMLLKRKKHA